MSQFNFRLTFLQCLVQIVSATQFGIYCNLGPIHARRDFNEGPFKREREGAIRLATLCVALSFNTMIIR